MPDSGRHISDEPSPREGRLNLHDVMETNTESDSVYRGVGAELRAEREHFGLLLSEISERLRIRVAYLEAIEAGRFGDLPGRIYAIGFLRSYAEFLGADGDVCVRMFKDEAGTGGHSRRLEFPVPQNENRRPGPATLLVALVLGIAVYGGWFVLQEDDTQTVDLVPAVPESIARQVQTTPVASAATASTDNARTGDAETDSPTLASDATGNGGAAKVSGSLMAANAADAAHDSDESLATGSGEAGQQVVATSIDSSAAIGSQGADVPLPLTAVDMATLNQPATAPHVPPLTDTTSQDRLTPEATDEEASLPVIAALGPPPLPPTAPRAVHVPRIFGVANTNARIVIRATDRAQILVKQAGGRTVLPHRVLQAGDEYHVPDLDGLLIRSDNVNGLQLVVDGRSLGAVGRLSDVENNLALDPDWLLANARSR